MEKNPFPKVQLTGVPIQQAPIQIKQFPELVKIPTVSYDLLISDQAQQKIDFVCMKIYDVEWSGTLFYNVTGSFINSKTPLKITVLDIYVQDIGTSVYTEFDSSPDVISYMCQHPELLEDGVQMGLIH
jgi:hypothetical protein